MRKEKPGQHGKQSESVVNELTGDFRHDVDVGRSTNEGDSRILDRMQARKFLIFRRWEAFLSTMTYFSLLNYE